MNLLEINAQRLFEILRTSAEKGLDERQVKINRREFGADAMRKNPPGRSFGKTVFGNIMLILFFLLSLFSFDVKKDVSSGICIILILCFYFAFQGIASRAVAGTEKKIHSYRLSSCTVIREGIRQKADYSDLVPGDIIVLSQGDVLPCDALVLRQKTLRVIEAQLTGNVSPVVKLTQEDVLSTKGCPYYECILFAGSIVHCGEALALVCNVGDNVFDRKNKFVCRIMPGGRPGIYEKAMKIADSVSTVWIILCIITVITGILKGAQLFSLFHIATALSVAVLPDLIVTLSELNLALSTLRLYKKGAVVKNLCAVDRMCDINCIAVDSGKYFRSENPRPHTVIVGDRKKKFKNASEPDVRELFKLACVACVGNENGDGMYYNDISVEESLLKAAARLGMPQSALYEEYLLLEKMPFNSENGMSRVIVFRDGEFYLVSLGLPECILRVCSSCRSSGTEKSFFEKDKRVLLEDSKLIAADNEGIAGVALKRISYREGAGQINNARGSVFIGFIGLHTAITADSAGAVNLCQKSGIDILLMTNESRTTAVGFADSLAIMKNGDEAVDGVEFERIDEGLFRADIKKYKVFLSFDPEKKAKIVKYRKEEGDIVASAVSSLYDIPLQAESDIAFCTGNVRDNNVARNSDVILTKGFAGVTDCIKYARCVYRNIRHMLEFFMLTQFTSASCAFMFLIFLPEILLLPIQIILYSLLAFFPSALVISTEKVRGTEMKASFGEENVNINFQNIITLPLICGLVSGLTATLSARIMYDGGASLAQCRGIAYFTLCVTALFMAMAVSGDFRLSSGIFKNKNLFAVSLPATLISLLLLITPKISDFLGMSITSVKTVFISVLISLIPCVLAFGLKLVKKYVFNNIK